MLSEQALPLRIISLPLLPNELPLRPDPDDSVRMSTPLLLDELPLHPDRSPPRPDWMPLRPDWLPLEIPRNVTTFFRGKLTT